MPSVLAAPVAAQLSGNGPQATLTVGDCPSGAPAASSARTANSGPVAVPFRMLSKPSQRVLVTGASSLACAPASSCQVLTPVAPFQLAYAVISPRPCRLAAIAGASAGSPLHGRRKAR